MVKSGCLVTWGGQLENPQTATLRLAVAVPLALLLIMAVPLALLLIFLLRYPKVVRVHLLRLA